MKQLQEHQKGIIAVLVAALLWSSGGILVKLVTLNPFQIAFARCVFASLVFLVLFRKKLLKVNGFTFLNAFFYAALLTLYVVATKTTTAANAIFLQYTAPIYVLLLEPVLNKTKYEKINIITISVCIVGMLLFFTGKLSPGDVKGNILALLSGITFAAFLLGMRKNKHEYQYSSIFYGNIIVVLILLPSMFELTTITLPDFTMLAFLGIFQIGIAYAIFSYGLKRVYAVEASLISMIEPVLNPVWVLIWYGEIPSFYAIIGGIIILIAIGARTVISGSPALRARFKN
ncbi:MAG TPA: EamA family transporter [Ignavibacteriaceae bacterium]|nr:EamA family transporter [Ignavibacteriaceae bacterium]